MCRDMRSRGVDSGRRPDGKWRWLTRGKKLVLRGSKEASDSFILFLCMPLSYRQARQPPPQGRKVELNSG